MFGCDSVAEQLDLAAEAFINQLGPDLGAQHLQRDAPAVLEVRRLEHDRHSAFTRLPFDTVAIGENAPGLERSRGPHFRFWSARRVWTSVVTIFSPSGVPSPVHAFQPFPAR